MAIPVKLPVFEGPLDLLMHLIEKNKIDIYDIPIAEITDQYLEYVHQMDRQDLDVTSEFLVMAATLLDIKCRMLLPREKDEETGEEVGDPREELVRRLLEYKMYKYLSEELAVCREQAGVRYFRAQKLPKEVLNYRPPINYDELLKGTDLQGLQKVFGEVLRRKKSRRDPIRSGFGKIKREEISIDNKTLYIRAYLQTHPRTDFRSLLESQESREDVIVTFLILLELMKVQKVHIVQDSIGGKILIESGAPEDASDRTPDPASAESGDNVGDGGASGENTTSFEGFSGSSAAEGPDFVGDGGASGEDTTSFEAFSGSTAAESPDFVEYGGASGEDTSSFEGFSGSSAAEGPDFVGDGGASGEDTSSSEAFSESAAAEGPDFVGDGGASGENSHFSEAPESTETLSESGISPTTVEKDISGNMPLATFRRMEIVSSAFNPARNLFRNENRGNFSMDNIDPASDVLRDSSSEIIDPASEALGDSSSEIIGLASEAPCHSSTENIDPAPNAAENNLSGHSTSEASIPAGNVSGIDEGTPSVEFVTDETVPEEHVLAANTDFEAVTNQAVPEGRSLAANTDFEAVTDQAVPEGRSLAANTDFEAVTNQTVPEERGLIAGANLAAATCETAVFSEKEHFSVHLWHGKGCYRTEPFRTYSGKLYYSKVQPCGEWMRMRLTRLWSRRFF